MNLVPHGILLQVTVWLIHFQHGFRLCSGGEPGYLDFDNLPETNFSCVGKVIGGYYADVETGCQMFHVCTIGQKDEIMDIKFLCLNGTVFDQETRVCERVDEVDCSKSERFYNLNLELYGNNAVTLSLHDVPDDEGDPTESIDDQHQTTVHPTTSTTTTTTQRPTNPPATATTTVYHQQNTGYSQQHYQNQPLYSTPQSSQSKSLYDDKNSGYHHQYIFHNGEQANNQATSFQLFSNQGVSSTTNQPQVHQARYGTTSSPQIILNSPSTVSSLFHGVSSTIQTLLNSNANNPSFINPLFHSHGTPSTTEHYTVHSNNPRETQEYHEDGVQQPEERSRRPLEAVQSTNQGKVSKLSISPVPESIEDEDSNEPDEEPTPSSQSSKISTGFLPTPTTSEPTARSFYPTPRTSPKPDAGPTQITRHIHLSPNQAIPQLKPQQITINLPPPDIQRIVQSPSPLLPSQSRVIVTAKASVSDESGRPLNTSELVVLPLPTIPTSYDDYKEGDESFDPFYRDVPKVRNSRSAHQSEVADKVRAVDRRKQALRRLKRAVLEDQGDYDDDEDLVPDYEYSVTDDSFEDDPRPLFSDSDEALDIATIKANFKKFKALLLGRGASREISSERKASKKHVSGSKSTLSHDGVNLPYNVADKDSSSYHREGKELIPSDSNTAANLSDDQKSNGDGNSGDSNVGGAENRNLMPIVETSEVGEKDDVKPVAGAKESETEEQGEAEPPADVQKIADQADPIIPMPDARHSDQTESILDDEKSALEIAKPKLADTTRESDAEAYIEPASMLNTKESDLEEYVNPKSATISKEAEQVEKSLEPNMNAKESDSKEYVTPKSSAITEEPEAHENVEDSEKPVPVLDTQKPVDREVSKDSEAEKDVETKKDDDKVVAEITSETKPTGDTEEPSSEVKITTEDSSGKVELELEAKINQPDLEAGQESINTSNDNKDSLTKDSVEPKMTSDVAGVKGKTTTEPEAENTDALNDGKDVEKAELSTKTQVSKAAENDEAETVRSEPGEDFRSKAEKSAKDSDLEEHVEAQPERPDMTPEIPQENEKSVISDDMKLHQAAADQMPKVKEKLMDHAMGKKQDSLDEKVGSTVETKDSALGEKSEKAIKPGEIKESKLSQLHQEKSISTSSSGWKPNKARTSSSGSFGRGNDAQIGKVPSTEQPELSEEAATKAKSEATNGSKLSKSASGNGIGDAVAVEPKVPHVKSLDHVSADELYSSKPQLLETKRENEEKRTETESGGSTEKSSESPNKVPSGVLDCGDAMKKHEESSYEDSRGEYDDDYSEEYISGSRESEPHERTSDEIGSQEPTSEYHDSGYDSGDEYASSVEDYVPISGEEYSTEDSRSTVSSEDYSTEGVLKFTDEIPEPNKKHLKQKNRAATSTKDLGSEDYVDDNYEPEHYRENSGEINKKPLESSNEKEGKEGKVAHQSSGEEKLNDEAPGDNLTTTTTTTTTTARPTPPSLFRPVSVRKNYKYIPPTTTPNPVVIKHRFGLLNPRPAKPIKSYNEIAPKPVIRKSPLLARKPYGTGSTIAKLGASQRRIDDFEDSSEIIWTSTEYIDEDEAPRENKLTRSANDVSFNETNESSGTAGEEVAVIVEESLTNGSTTLKNNYTSTDEPSATERTFSNTLAYLSTPYPLLKVTTTGNFINTDERKMVQAEEPTSETLKATQDEGSLEMSTNPSSTTEGTTASSVADGRPLKVDTENKKEEKKEKEEEEETSKVPISMIPFSCIDKEPYRFYGDPRDCRLFHYCSPGFTAKQMLDFRFVCENHTMFDEESQSCKYDVENSKCANKQW